MTAMQLHNLWSYIQGMSLKKKDREWLASKLLEPVDDAKTARQKAFVKETLTRALKEVEQAKRGGARAVPAAVRRNRGLGLLRK